MRLIDWMKKTDIDIIEASRAFGVSTFAIKKWLKSDRIPRPKTQARIKKITKGAVSGDDWMLKD